MFKRAWAAVVAATCLLMPVFPRGAGVVAEAAGGSARIAMELSTGKVLEEDNADARLPMASTTKIMTALLICEDCDPDEVVRVPDEAVGVEGSSIYLKKGEEIDVRDLLYGLMLRSGNDAATALAVVHSGSMEGFVAKMNERAGRLGAENTRFRNPSGLPDDGHYTTARDLCRISCAAMRNELFRKVVGTRSWHGKFRSYVNKNKMLQRYDGATGIKTGYTVKAGRCLVSSACRENMEVVCVVLNRYDMYADSAAMLDRAFERNALCRLTREKVFMCGGVACALKKECTFVVRKNADIVFSCVPRKDEGGSCGRLNIYDGNSLIFTGNLYSIV